MAASRSSVRTVASPARGSMTTRSASGSRPRGRQVAGQRVAVRREERAIGQDPPAPAGRPEERRQQQVDVGGQAEHQADLGGSCADDPGHRRAKGVVHREPRSIGREPGVDAETRPGIELGLDRGADRPWLEPERLARVVDGRGAVGSAREQEPVAQRRHRIGGVAGDHVSFGRLGVGVRSGHLTAPLLVGSGRPRVASTHARSGGSIDAPRRRVLPCPGPRRLWGRVGRVRAHLPGCRHRHTGLADRHLGGTVLRGTGLVEPEPERRFGRVVRTGIQPRPDADRSVGDRPGLGPGRDIHDGHRAAAIAALTAASPPPWVLEEFPSEHPAHDVTLTRGYWIDTDEVTVAAFAAFKDGRRLQGPGALVRRRLDMAQVTGSSATCR